MKAHEFENYTKFIKNHTSWYMDNSEDSNIYIPTDIDNFRKLSPKQSIEMLQRYEMLVGFMSNYINEQSQLIDADNHIQR